MAVEFNMQGRSALITGGSLGIGLAIAETFARAGANVAITARRPDVLETARQEKVIGAPLEARVRLEAGADLLPILEQYAGQLPALFIVSEVELAAGETLQASVLRATGVKCERCWKYTHDVGNDADLPTVCAPCAAAVKEMVAEIGRAHV